MSLLALDTVWSRRNVIFHRSLPTWCVSPTQDLYFSRVNRFLCISLHLLAVEGTHSTFVTSDIHPPSSRGRRLLEVCNHQGWGVGWGLLLLFRGENDELAQEAKKKCVRCEFHQSWFPHVSTWLCLSQILVLDAWCSVYSVWRVSKRVPFHTLLEELSWSPLPWNKPNGEAKNMTALRLCYLATDKGPSNTLYINQQSLVFILVWRRSTEELDVFRRHLCSILLWC